MVWIGLGQLGPALSRGQWAAAQQRDVPGAAFREVGGDDPAERARSAGDDVRGIGGEFGGERSGEAAAEPQSRNECGVGTKGDLILGDGPDQVCADALGGADGVIGPVDVDEATPALGELLMTDDTAQPPQRCLVDSGELGPRG